MSTVLYEKLPEEVLQDNPNLENRTVSVEDFLRKTVPKGDIKNLESDFKWQFLLDKHAVQNKKAKRVQRKKHNLTRKQRKELQLLKLPKTGWNYKNLESIREMWREYMRQNLELVEREAPSCADPDWGSFSTVLARSELIGSEIKVVRAKQPGLVGLSGTVVLETKMTLQIVTPRSQLKVIPKDVAVFEFVLDRMRCTVFGKHILTRPGERSVKKIKSQMLPDLL